MPVPPSSLGRTEERATHAFLTVVPASTIGDWAGAVLALGALIGSGRQWRERMARLRTNAPVALGASPQSSPAVQLPAPGRGSRPGANVMPHPRPPGS
jgi:hypothetical protein